MAASLLPSSTLLDPSPFADSLPALTRFILRHASCLCTPTRRVSSQTHQWRGALPICCCLPPLVPACPSHQAWGTLFVTRPASMRGISARHQQSVQFALPITTTRIRFFAAPSSHPCPIETTSSWLILSAQSLWQNPPLLNSPVDRQVSSMGEQ
ncbi:hypothetical protein CSPAE12_08325 [Colletotrichum incanum]|nr:hypothetical protein CSPAE12_08325 [Colletotrichum incanum]